MMYHYDYCLERKYALRKYVYFLSIFESMQLVRNAYSRDREVSERWAKSFHFPSVESLFWNVGFILALWNF